MENLFKRIATLLGRTGKTKQSADENHAHLHVVSPDSVSLPFPRLPRDEICVPASISGRDLSTGRL